MFLRWPLACQARGQGIAPENYASDPTAYAPNLAL
jgi:hypothetical protein